MEAVRERFFEIRSIAGFEPYFFFAFLDDAQEDVLRCWKKPKRLGESRFNFITGKNI